MATYTELFEIISNSIPGAQELRDKIASAAIIAADIINAGGDAVDPPWDQTAGAHDQRVKWAILAYMNPILIANELLPAVVAANESATQAMILAAPDTAIQTNVNAVIDSFAANLS